MSRKVLVTGGAGFIGSALTAELARQGCILSVLDNLSCGRRENLPAEDVDFHAVSILDSAALKAAVRSIAPSWVIHLAAMHFIPYCNAHPFEASEINLQGTINVLEAAREVPSVEKVFFTSTAAVYADAAVPVSETAPTGPLDIYGLTKLVGEKLVQGFHATTGIPCVVGRLFNAYGPCETNPHLIPEILRQVKEGVRALQLGNVTTRRDYIHTSDMASAICRLMAHQTAGVEAFNIGSGVSLNAREVVECFVNAVTEELLITVADDRVRKVDRALLQADIGKIRNLTGWEPTMDFQAGIDALVSGRN